MLTELRIRGYAVIDDLRLELGPGLNVLTGETGAGKSIVVGALSLLLGRRASSDVVREGEERALVEAVFDVEGREEIAARCREAGLEDENGWLILRREVHREGRNRAWINGSPATAGLIWELGSGLVELHGQHEHQALLETSAQRRILDAYGGAQELVDAVGRAHRELRKVRVAIREERDRAAELRQRADYLRFKAEEIESADLRPAEDEELRTEARKLEHSEDLTALSGTLHAAIYGDEESLVDRLGALSRPLSDLLEIDPDPEEFREMYASARAELEELGRRLAAYHRDVDHDPGRLDRIRNRREEIHRLKRKYGGELEAVIAAGTEARRELKSLESSDRRIGELEDRGRELARRRDDRAARLTGIRREAAARLEAEIEPVLSELSLEDGRFAADLRAREEAGAEGAEEVEFRVSLNPGFPPGPLSKIASGGELSRVMLALKTALARVDRVPCLVFDEIDAGVGGRIGRRMAERLVAVAADHQVFVVTHLPQIAARAGAHLQVEKREVEGRATATVTHLEGSARVEEVARMLSGDPESGLSRRHAEELLGTGMG